MKLMITGASGVLGRAFMRTFADNTDFEVIGTAYSRAQGGLHKLDLLDDDAVADFIREHQPRVIIHSAAERHPDVSEKDPEGTRQLNVVSTERLANLAKETGAWLVYISTDYVFDGTNPPYKPSDTTNPLNIYGISKRDGEDVIWAVTDDACILRVPMLYGQVENLDESPVTILAKSLLEHPNEPLVLDAWAIRYPTFIDDVALVVRQMIEHRQTHPDFRGPFHWSHDTPYTKYQMAVLVAKALGLSTEHLTPSHEPGGGAPRPKNCHLDCSALEGLGIGRQTPFETAIREVLKPFAS